MKDTYNFIAIASYLSSIENTSYLPYIFMNISLKNIETCRKLEAEIATVRILSCTKRDYLKLIVIVHRSNSVEIRQ